jgi:ABC-2 type transport system ATP-binding protein
MTTVTMPRSIAPGSMNEWAIDLSNVSKTYKGKVHALRGISMRVRRGEVFGFLGPNGAGKSTLVKILLTIIRPTQATGHVLGARIGDKATLRRVGYLPEHHRFPDYLTGAQVVDFYGALAGVPREERRKRTPALLELVGMKDWGDAKVRGYSKGMRQRVGIAQALVNNPDLVVLDEPTDGVDPVGRRDIREVVSRLRDEGKTVFINSHLLSELEMVCDRVAILVKGNVASQGTIEELTRDRRYIEIEVAAIGPDEQSPEDALAALIPGMRRLSLPSGSADERLDSASATRRTGDAEFALASGERVLASGKVMRVYTDDAASVQPIIDALRARAMVIRAVRPVRPSLEDLFMEAVTDPTTGKVMTPGAKTEAEAGRGGAN